MNKLFYILSWITIILAIILMFTCSFWLIYPYKILDFKNPKYPVITKEIKQGGTLQFVSNYCKHMEITAKTSGSFINGIIYTVPDVMTNRNMGCNKIIVNVPVPKELPLGVYHFQRIYTYHVNPIRDITITHTTENFKIIESTQSSELRLREY